MPDNDEEIRQPSKTPGDLSWERASSKALFSRTATKSVTESAREERDEKFAAFNDVRLEAKKKVYNLTPVVLEDYKEDLKQDRGVRRYLSWFVFGLVVFWLCAVGVIIFSTGKGWLNLDARVLVALTVGATVSIVGLLATVLGYFFTKKDEQIRVYDKLFQIMLDNESSDREE